jgi:hypothetical protein
MRKTIITVPKIAGKMPPSVFDSRGSAETNSHDAGEVEAELAADPHRVRPQRAHDLADRDLLLGAAAVAITRCSAKSASRVVDVTDGALLEILDRAALRRLGVEDRLEGRPGRLAPSSQGLAAQA